MRKSTYPELTPFGPLIRNVDYASLVKFYEELKTRSPCISIEQFNISANTANPAQLLVSIRVSSVEIAR
jgi:hypothetical protein